MRKRKLALAKDPHEAAKKDMERFYEEVVKVFGKETGFNDIGCICRAIILASMPINRLPDAYFNRKFKNFTLIIGSDTKDTAHTDPAIPYGIYPRMIFSWIINEVIRTKSKKIILGNDVSELMKKVGIVPTEGENGTKEMFRKQIMNIVKMSVHFEHINKEKGFRLGVNLGITEQHEIHRSYTIGAEPDPNCSFISNIVVDDLLYKEIMKNPVPMDCMILKWN